MAEAYYDRWHRSWRVRDEMDPDEARNVAAALGLEDAASDELLAAADRADALNRAGRESPQDSDLVVGDKVAYRPPGGPVDFGVITELRGASAMVLYLGDRAAKSTSLADLSRDHGG